MNSPATNVNGIRRVFGVFVDRPCGFLEIERDLQHHGKPLKTFGANTEERMILVEGSTEERLDNRVGD